MSKKLVLAEKPSVARELARVLDCHQNRDGYIEGNQYIVTWALGHLVTLADPQSYGKEYEIWDLSTLPMLPSKMQLTVIPQTSKQYKCVKSQLMRKDVDEVIIATDAGREGELVARWILIKAGCHKPCKRLWISSQTDKALKEGFAHLKSSKQYDTLFESAQARSQADWLVGLNVTRALTCKFNAQLSAGRVQTPTLAMIVSREQEIRAFTPKEYEMMRLKTDGFILHYRDAFGNARFFNPSYLSEVAKKIKGQNIEIVNVVKKLKREIPPQLYDLNELQREANRRYQFTAKETLDLMQRLYEEHKLLTYPRTDSRYISKDIVPTLKDRLRSLCIDDYEVFARELLKKDIKANKRFVDDGKVSDHHAIIPTEEYVDLRYLSPNELKIYDLVVRRFLAVLMEESTYEQTQIEACIGKEHFYAKGNIMKSKGWRSVYDRSYGEENEEDEKDQNLPNIKTGMKFPVLDIIITKAKTTPPKRYNEATLLSAMEHPSKFVNDEKLRTVLDAASGIGTVATRADIIEKLFRSNYIERRGNEIFPLSKGMQLIELVPPELKSVELTARWEQRLEQIRNGTLRPDLFIKDMHTYAKELVQSVKMSDASYHHDNMSRKRCPVCDKFMLEVNGKRGKMLVCSDRECGYRENLSYISNARCPKCHKKLSVVGEKEKKLYVCGCGFREKFDRFNEQLKERGNKASKQQLHAYMKKQEQEEKQIESPFAAALREAMEAKKK